MMRDEISQNYGARSAYEDMAKWADGEATRFRYFNELHSAKHYTEMAMYCRRMAREIEIALETV